jgi:hypothetical protein
MWPLILDTISSHIRVAANSIVLVATLGLVNKKLRVVRLFLAATKFAAIKQLLAASQKCDR